MPLSADDWVIRRLNTHSFETIWNGAPGEYTVNIALVPITPHGAIGAVVLANVAYGLPDTDAFTVFALPYGLFANSALLVADTWLASDVILDRVQTLLSVYTEMGLTLPSNAVYLYKPAASQAVMVAIRSTVYRAMFGITTPNFYISSYRNPNITTAITSHSFQLPRPLTTVSVLALQTQIAACLTTNADGTFVVWNGRDVDPAVAHIWQPGDYVDVRCDPSVFAAYDAEVMTLNSGYMSTRYNGPREILHCPKALNPSNWLLTHEAVYFSVWDAATRSGVRIPRLDPHCIEQISHADWSISHNVLQNLQTYLNTSNIIVRVRVRRPAMPHVLQPTAAMLQALYESVDAEITEHLRGSIDAKATFWTAAALEQNPYVGLLFNTPTGATDSDVLDVYRHALGYYNIAGLLGGCVQTQIKAGQTIIVNKPYCLYQQYGHAMVFVGGRKLPSAKVALQDLPQGRLAISIDRSIPITPHSYLDITQTENGAFYATTITNTVTGIIATTPTPYVSVYRQVAIGTQPPSWDATSLAHSYIRLSPGSLTYQIYPNASGVGYDIVIASGLANKTLCVMDDIYVNTTTIDLDPVLLGEHPLIFSLHSLDQQGNSIPLLNAETVEVYVNGLRLAPSLDYNLLPWTDPTTGGIGRIDVAISNQSYFDRLRAGNTVEIIAHSSIQASRDVSYVLGQTLRHQVTPSFWNPTLSRCFVEGLLLHDEDWHTDWIHVNGQPEGGVGYWDTMVHRRLADVLQNYDPVTDYTRRTIVDKILNHITPPIPNLVVLTAQHHLYSVYLATIIADVISGVLILADDPNPRLFLQQFRAYADLKEADASLATYAGPINTDYVAVAAHYANYDVLSPSTLQLVQRLISYTLSPSTTLGETLI